MFNGSKILVVAAHPDDEVLGCGGTIARHVDNRDSVHVLFIADGVSARTGDRSGLDRRRDSAKRAARILGAQAPRFLDFPDNRLDTVALLDVVRAVEQVASELAPAVVYTHHGSDLNIDHRVVHQAVATAFRPLPGATVRAVFTFETLSSTECATPAFGNPFQPNRFVDVKNQLERKISALNAYSEEMRPFPHPRSIEAVRALAAFRGATAGLQAAEAFETVRWIDP